MKFHRKHRRELEATHVIYRHNADEVKDQLTENRSDFPVRIVVPFGRFWKRIYILKGHCLWEFLVKLANKQLCLVRYNDETNWHIMRIDKLDKDWAIVDSYQP